MDTISMNVLPFTIQCEGFYALVAECRGLLKDEGDRLTLETQQQDVWFKVFKSAVQSIHIPISEVVSLDLTDRLFCNNLVLQTTNVELLNELPAASQGRVRFKIARKDIEMAKLFVEDFHDRLAHLS
jgi:hypothetical protein